LKTTESGGTIWFQVIKIRLYLTISLGVFYTTGVSPKRITPSLISNRYQCHRLYYTVWWKNGKKWEKNTPKKYFIICE